MMMRALFLFIFSGFVTVAQDAAADWVRLGYGRLVTNDYIGDGNDRWRTGSIASSRIWGPEGMDQLPAGFGDVLELRLGFEIIAPDRPGKPAPGDRPYAGSVSVGLHTHVMNRGFETALGADLVVTGKSTGLAAFQRELHEAIDAPRPSDQLLDAQIGNKISPTAVAEVARYYQLGNATTLRPFVEARLGAETLVRTGVDVTVGRIGTRALLVRDPVSGQRYRTSSEGDTGFTMILGADVAHVADSIYLPEDRGYVLTDTRDRVRLGVHWQGNAAAAFYGLTWLGEEFVDQGDDQIIGSVRFNWRF